MVMAMPSKTKGSHRLPVKWRRRDELASKEVIDAEAKKAGVVKDLAWSAEGKLALVVERDKNEEAYVAFDAIDKVGDVIFIKSSGALETVPTKVCPTCKHRNPLEAKFCAKCGKTLEEKEKK